MTVSAPVLEVTALRKLRPDPTRGFVLDVPSFHVMAGERVALVGPSGSGKSTLIDLLALALTPDAAERFVVRGPADDGMVDVAACWRERADAALTRLRSRVFGYVQQVGGLLGFLSVRRNIQTTQRLSGRTDPARIERLAHRLGIAEALDAYPDRLSVGQRQRVAIARALAHDPDILLADEPTAALDVDHAARVMGLLVEQAEESGTALVVSSHDVDLVRRFGFTLVAAEFGRDDTHLRARFGRGAS